MRSLFGDYCREKGMVVAENEKGFMTAFIHSGVCLVDNFYVVPELRGTRAALRLTLDVIRQAETLGCVQFVAEIYKVDPLYAYILRLHRHFGMDIVEDTEFKTITSKRINTNARPENIVA